MSSNYRCLLSRYSSCHNRTMRLSMFLLAWSTFVESVLSVTPTADTTSDPCPWETASCTFSVDVKKPKPSVWAWKTHNQTRTTTFVAATVVTIVNTLRNITSYSTVFNTVPKELSEFISTKTNEAGTRTETITYTIAPPDKEETVTTTVLCVLSPETPIYSTRANLSLISRTYPNFFFKWPDY